MAGVDIEKEVDDIKKRLSDLEQSVKTERVVKQVVFEKEGDAVRVRAKVLVKRASGAEETWEDVTDKFTQEKIQEVLNGA